MYLRVVVAQGRVAVGEGTSDATLVLNAGDIAQVTPSGERRIDRGALLSDELAWTEGRLVFSGLPLRDVIPRIERWCMQT